MPGASSPTAVRSFCCANFPSATASTPSIRACLCSHATAMRRNQAACSLLSFRLLLQFREELRVFLGNVVLVPLRIDERILCAILHPGVLAEHSVVIAVRAQEHVAGQRLQRG